MVTRSEPSVGIMVVNYFSGVEVGNLVRSLHRSKGRSKLHIAVVDNSCSESEFELLDTLKNQCPGFGSFDVAMPDKNLGYAGGNNLAFSLLRDHRVEYVFVVNPDVVLISGDLSQAIEESSGAGGRMFVAPTRSTEGVEFSGVGAMSLRSSRTRQLLIGEDASSDELVYPGGHFMGLSSEMWVRLGGLDERYFLYCEEADFALRAQLDTGLITTLPGVRISHSSGLTTGSAGPEKSRTTIRHASRSKALLYRAHTQLRPYLGPMILSRIGWSVRALFRHGATSAIESLGGLWDGLTSDPGPPHLQLRSQAAGGQRD